LKSAELVLHCLSAQAFVLLCNQWMLLCCNSS
jgi:hypothetical protein